MTLHSKKQISVLLVLLLIALDFCFGLKVSNADNIRTFPDAQIAAISNFEEFYEKIFQLVAGKMGLEIDKRIPKPIILTDVHLTPQEFSGYLGRKVKVLIPYYLYRENTLVIPINCKLDSLVHELVHYFQVMYQNDNLDINCGLYIENLEMEALEIQRWFKAKFMEPHKLAHDIAIEFSQQIVNLPQ